MKEFCEDEPEYVRYLEETAAKLLKILNDLCFEGDRFVRGFRDNGDIIGSGKNNEAAMWLNPQRIPYSKTTEWPETGRERGSLPVFHG